MADSTALVIGGGIAGLTAALEMARFGLQVDVAERELFFGGHAAQLACKATDACVKCGACLIAEALASAKAHPGIRLHSACRLEAIQKSKRFAYTLRSEAPRIIAAACTGCGVCRDVCPADAIACGAGSSAGAFFAIRREACCYAKDRSCTLCRDKCPAGAIELEAAGRPERGEADALVLATGFQTFDPTSKPYGFGIFPNVITNLDLEHMLRREGRMVKPSDGSEPRRVAFVQCVGSRDAKLGHLWCSGFCCGAALRAAGLVKARRPETEITVFYIDIQSFGRDFEAQYRAARRDLRLVRAIPAEAFPLADGGLRLSYVEGSPPESREEAFELVVLSVGMLPSAESGRLADMLGLALEPSGFVSRTAPGHAPGVFAAGAACGPMAIADALADGRRAAWQALEFLGRTRAGREPASAGRPARCSSFLLAGNEPSAG